MLRTLLYGTFYAILIILLFYSCTKEYSCENCIEANKIPIAIAGSDTAIGLPLDSLLLDGSKSRDPDGKISLWQWTKIAGPASFTIVRASSEKTLVKNLKEGIYQFELKVTDDKGASAKDTVQVTVNSIATMNHPPIACAGADQTITLPTSTVNLDGSCSSDPDNNIVAYQWTKIAGPSSFNIINTITIQTQISDLIEGVYQFELKVTDADGLYSKDTVQVNASSQEYDCSESNRDRIAVRLTPVGNLSKPREGMAVAAAGNKILFAGGLHTPDYPEYFGSSQVDIYDEVNNSWSTANLSKGRWSISAVAAGNTILFAGGEWGDGAIDSLYDNVDIYDASTNTWKVTHLSQPRGFVAAGAVGEKVIFAGGEYNRDYDVSSVVDIYDILTGSFSQFSLSHPRAYISAVTANNKIYFAGGSVDDRYYNSPSAVIDIFDNTSGQWTTSTLIEPMIFPTGTIMGAEIFWASNCTVEIKNISSSSSSIAHPFKSLGFGVQSVIKDNYILLIGGTREFLGGDYSNLFDIYNTTTKKWSIGMSPVKIQTAVAHNNQVYITDGVTVYKMDF